jgi:hypothetical protein
MHWRGWGTGPDQPEGLSLSGWHLENLPTPNPFRAMASTRPRVLTPAVVQKIKELRADGLTVPEIMRGKPQKGHVYRALA